MEVIKSYRDRDDLRKSFDALAQETYGLSFEDWYQNGFWKDSYNPYSIAVDGRIVANVSVNTTDFLWNHSVKHYIQLGTVMTARQYRNQGLIRRIMEEIERDYANYADGFYLFANDTVLDFYPRFGFRSAVEYRYTKPVTIQADPSILPVPMENQNDWNNLVKIMENSIPCGPFMPVGTECLTMFYITKFLQNSVYYDPAQDAYVIAEVQNGELLIHWIFSKSPVRLDGIICAFGRDIRQVLLGFTPDETDSFTPMEVHEDDTTLFLKGNDFPCFERDRILFPTLVHA